MTPLERALLHAFIGSLETRSRGSEPTLCMPVGSFTFEELDRRMRELRGKGVEVVKVKGGVL